MNGSLIAGVRTAVILAALALPGGCGGGGEDDDFPPPGQAANGSGYGSVHINDPSAPAEPAGALPFVILEGTAFVTDSYVCCSGDAVHDSGVTVTWKNTTTGESGWAMQSFGPEHFGYFYFLEHSWSARVPLAAGANMIEVTASDGKGNWATDTITVTRA